MVQYFIANPDAKELIAFPDGKAFLNNTTNSYDALSYGKATNQESKIVFRDEFKKEIEAELISNHLSRAKRYIYNITAIIWNISFTLRKYPNDENIKSFCKHIVLSIQTCYLSIDEMWETVNKLYKELNKYVKSKYEK